MILAILTSVAVATPLLSPPLGDAHSDHHPAAIQVYLEVPGLRATRAAYTAAPLVRMLSDPELLEAIAEFAGKEIDPLAEFGRALEEAAPEGVGEALVAVADGLERLSLSVGGLDTAPAAPAEGEEPAAGSALTGVHVRALFDFATEETIASLLMLLREGASAAGIEAELGADHGLLPLPRPEGFVVEYRVDGARFELLARMAETDTVPLGVEVSAPVSSREDYRALQGVLGVPSGVPVWGGFVDLGRDVWNALAERGGDEPPNELDLWVRSLVLPAQPTAWRTSLSSGAFHVTKAQYAVADSDAVDTAFLHALPHEAIGAWAWTVDTQALFQRAMKLATAESGSSFEELMKTAEEATGVRPDRDVVAHIGSTMFVYMEPIRAIGPPKVRAYLELTDAEAFERSLDTFASWVGENFTEGVSVKAKTYRGTNLTTFGFDALSDMGLMQPTPTLAVVDGRLLVSLNAVHAKREIKRLDADADETTPTHSLLEAKELNAGALAFVGHLDWPELIDGVYGLASAAAGMFGGFAGGDLGIDFSALPPAELITRHLSPARSFSTHGESFLVSRTTSPFGPEVYLMGLGWILPMAALQSGDTVEIGGSVGMEPTEIPAELAITEDEAQLQSTTRAAMRRVRTGLAVYKMDRGDLPNALGELMDSSDAFPDGFLGGAQELPVDAWGNGFVYRYEGNDVYFLYSRGANGQDEGGGGDDISAN